MLKRIFFIIILFNFLSHCDYKPVYSDQNKVNYKIIITSFSGDKDINNQIVSILKRNSKEVSDEIINIVIQINGKKRGLIQTKPNITEEKLFEIINNNEKIKKYLDQKNIKRKIYIKDKLLNIII